MSVSNSVLDVDFPIFEVRDNNILFREIAPFILGVNVCELDLSTWQKQT